VTAAGARSWFAKSPQRLSRLGGVGGLVMIGIGARLAVTGRAD
jgi:threonine/homoserine/homoserine lactone efflux protein